MINEIQTFNYRDVARHLPNLHNNRIPMFKKYMPFNIRLDDIVEINLVEGGLQLQTIKYETIYLDSEGYLHNEDGPAYINGDNYMNAIHGNVGSVSYPAVCHNGTEYWYTDCEIHREDGPAKINKDIEIWYLHGKIHREDGPAVIHLKTGEQFWHKNGFLHRSDGPAHYNPHINSYNYYISGKCVTAPFKKWCKKNKCEGSDQDFEIFAFEQML